MNSIWSRFVRSTYRREPVVSFVVTAGVVEAAIGGLNEHWSLVAFGLGTVGAAIALGWQQRRQVATLIDRTPLHALPAYDSHIKLPELKPKRKSLGGKH